MPLKNKPAARHSIPNASVRRSGSLEKTGSETEVDLLKWVLGSLTDCRAEQMTLNSPWVSQVPEGWFYVYCIRVGVCQLMQDGFAEPLQLHSGDIVILPRCRQHSLRDSHATDWSNSNRVSWFDDTPNRTTHRVEESSRRPVTRILVCRFRKPIRESNLLFDVLPEYLVHRKSDFGIAASSESIVAALVDEVAQFPASERIIEHLVKALVLQTTRHCEDQLPNQQNATKTLLKDRVIAKALALMHSRPEFGWTVGSLATAVGVSRSTFATRFANQIGVTPLNYLRRERMQKAAELLCDETLGIKEIAFSVGYDSESAFNNAFKQWSGITPGLFRSERSRSA